MDLGWEGPLEQSTDIRIADRWLPGGEELGQVRQELEQLVRWRRIFGFSAADNQRYWDLTRRELELLHAQHVHAARLDN